MLKVILPLILSKHPFVVDLPYNLGWQKKLPADLSRLLKTNPIEVYDIGARRLSLPELSYITHVVNYTGFDADADECERLSNQPSIFNRQQFLPYYVANNCEEVNFNLIEERGCSSAYVPAQRFAELFAEKSQVNIEKTVRLKGTKLSAIRVDHNLAFPDLLKLDTQGSELDILKSFEEELKYVPLVECEVEFVEQYSGQPLFYDVSAWLYERGYELIYLNRVFKQRSRIYSGAARGQILFGDALFCKKEHLLDAVGEDRLMRLVILLWCYGHIDIAYQISTKLSNEKSKQLAKLFDVKKYGTSTGRLKQFCIGKIDTIAMFWLACRKTNGLRTDQDRCWPIR